MRHAAQRRQEDDMDNKIKGKVRNIKGRVKDAAGALTGDKSTQAEGWVDRAGGRIQEGVGEVERELDERSEKRR
jgi:uncharacterized protein YjbJ (UPF0337 family)